MIACSKTLFKFNTEFHEILDGMDRWTLITFALPSTPVQYAYNTKLRIPNLCSRLMFWCDWEVPPKIEVAALDGSNRHDLINTSLQMVQDMAIDFQGGKLYWTDTRTHTIERADLDGGHREVVAGSETVEKPVSLTVHGDYIYWTDV